jgi:hypothetical protein
VIFLKPGGGFGGGRFSVNTSCSSSCTGIPTVLDPSNPNNTCSGKSPTGCDPGGGSCSSCTCKDGCSCTCTTTKTGFGNFGGFIAMDRNRNPPNTGVAQRQGSVADVLDYYRLAAQRGAAADGQKAPAAERPSR